MEIDNKTLTKMKYVLNDNSAWVSKDQLGMHAKEKHDVEEKEHVGSDNELEAMFETAPTPSSLKKPSTSTWSSRMESQLETDMCQIWDT